jgi:hypothetical protein
MKWFLIILTIVVAYAIYSGNMGGAKSATQNYQKVLTGGK